MKTITKTEMPDGTIKTTVKYSFRLFGWNIYIANHGMHTRARNPHRNNVRKAAIARREEIVGGRICEMCGREQSKYICLIHLLPKGTPGRGDAENVRIVCKECKCGLDKSQHYHGLRQMEAGGGSAADKGSAADN